MILTSREDSRELIREDENSTGVWGTNTRDLGCSSLDPDAPMLFFWCCGNVVVPTYYFTRGGA